MRFVFFDRTRVHLLLRKEESGEESGSFEIHATITGDLTYLEYCAQIYILINNSYLD